MNLRCAIFIFISYTVLLTGCGGRQLRVVELPPTWHDDIPIMEGMTPVDADFDIPEDGRKQTWVTFHASKPMDEVMDFYANTKGWDVSAPRPPFDETGITAGLRKGNFLVTVLISRLDGNWPGYEGTGLKVGDCVVNIYFYQ